jgi:hypothetical protein
MTQVISEYLNFEWPSTGGITMSILRVNGVDNSTPLSTMSMDDNADIRVDGYLLNAATGLQFQPYGPTSAPPTASPTSSPAPGTPFPRGGMDPMWDLPQPTYDPTYLIINGPRLKAFIDTGVYITPDTWWKLVFTYNNAYQPIPINFQHITLDYSLAGVSYEIRLTAIGNDYSPITSFDGILLNGYSPPGWTPGTPVGNVCDGTIVYAKTDQRPSTLAWSITSPVPGANVAAYQNNLPVVESTTVTGAYLYIYGTNLDKWNLAPDTTLAITIDGVPVDSTALQYVSATTLIVLIPGNGNSWADQVVSIYGGKLNITNQYYVLFEILVRGSTRSY